MRVTAAQEAIDERHMQRCLDLAAQGRGRTHPNPLVGCVILGRSGEVLAEGWHRKAGTDHAEVAALKALGRRSATGATLYVNLEPCMHVGRTPACAPVVAAAGIKRVVIGSQDPVPGHGGGIEYLRRKRLAVRVGVLKPACDRLNLPFLTWGEQQRPAFTLKAASTLDGKIATVTGQSKWITGEAARHDVLRLRHEHDAVMVGIRTVLADDPRLTCHGERGLRDPTRIVLDRGLETPPTARLLPRRRSGSARVLIACGPTASAARERALVAQGAEILRTRTHANGYIDVRALAPALAAQQIQSVLVEGGGEVHAYLMNQGLADQLVLYLAPMTFGGAAPSWVGGKGHQTIAAAFQWQFDLEVTAFGRDLRLTAVPAPRAAERGQA